MSYRFHGFSKFLQIGDYGLAKTLHPEDYLAADPSITSNQSLTSQTNTDEEFKNRFQPLRWLSPETLGSIVKEPSATSSGGSLSITRQESIWSLGITLWEMCYLCQKQPFDQIADQLFLQASLIHSNLTLPPINIKVGTAAFPKIERKSFHARISIFPSLSREWKARHFNR